MEFLKLLLTSSDFMPHGYCYRWIPGLVWLHVISGSLIIPAYLTIPFTLVHIARRRKDLPFNRMFLCFGITEGHPAGPRRTCLHRQTCRA